MPSAATEHHTESVEVNPPPRLDRRPWTVRVREACREQDLHPSTRLVALTVASYLDDRGTWGMPIDQLAADTGLSERQVFRHLAALKKAGILDWTPGGGNRRNKYRLGEDLASGGTPAPRRHPVTHDTATLSPMTGVRIRGVSEGSTCVADGGTSTSEGGGGGRRYCRKHNHSWPDKPEYGPDCKHCLNERRGDYQDRTEADAKMRLLNEDPTTFHKWQRDVANPQRPSASQVLAAVRRRRQQHRMAQDPAATVQRGRRAGQGRLFLAGDYTQDQDERRAAAQDTAAAVLSTPGARERMHAMQVTR